MTLFVVDASHYQPSLPIEDLSRRGFSALIIKSTEGTGYVDPSFGGFLARARRVGLPMAAYHYLLPGTSDRQAAHIADVVPSDVPVWLDAEAGATRDDAYGCAAGLRARGRRVAGIYHAAQPKPGFGGWWRAAYLSDPSGAAVAVYGRQGGDAGRGWLPGVDLWQFCQHGRIPGHAGDVDFSAYRGALEQMLGHGWFWTGPQPATSPVPGPRKDDDMPLLFVRNAETGRVYQVVDTQVGKRAMYVPSPDLLHVDVRAGASMVEYPDETTLAADFPISLGTRVIA